MSVAQKLKWKKLINQLRYIYQELELVEEISNASAADFQKYYEDFCQKNDIDLADLNRTHADHIEEVYKATPQDGKEEEEKSDDEQQLYEVFSKLFKKIALFLHPDRLSSNMELTNEEKEERIETFKRAKTALEEGRYFILIECAEKYNIPIPRNFKQQNRWMKKELNHATELTGKVIQSYNYMFAECEEDNCRDLLMQRFLNQLFEINVEN